MKKRYLAMFLVSMMTLSLLGGCGESSDTEANKNEEKKTGGTVKLTVWGAEEDQELLQSLCQGFASANSDTKFEFSYGIVAEGDCKSTLCNNVAEGADVYAFADDQMATFAAAGVIDPVLNPDEIKNNNNSGAVEAGTVNGVLYGYPMTADNGYFMYYDKSVFSETDLETLDGMLAAAVKAGKQVYIPIDNGWYMYMFFGNTGLEVGLNDDGISNYCNWNATDTAITGADVLNGMIAVAQNAGCTKDTGVGLVDGVTSGIYCAGISGVWDAAALQELWGDNLGAVKLPTYTVAGQQVQLASFAGYKLVGVNAYSENKEWAHALANWLTNEDSQLTRFRQRQLGPSNNNAAASDEVSSSVALKALAEQSPYSKLQRIGGNYWGPAGSIGYYALKNNPEGIEIQKFLDTCVESITKSNGQ